MTSGPHAFNERQQRDLYHKSRWVIPDSDVWLTYLIAVQIGALRDIARERGISAQLLSKCGS